MMYERNARSNRLHTSLWPIWWVDSNPNEFYWAVGPLLSYAEYDRDGTDEWLLGGALWYRAYDADFRHGRTLLLLGTLYEEVRRRERGYRSRGSLWGVLWQHQQERANDYSKFSVLKFLYRRTEQAGQVRHRVLGIPIGGSRATEI